MTEFKFSEREEQRILSLVKDDGELKAGDKCPMKGCRGILEEETRVLFNPHRKPFGMFGFTVLVCDRKKCNFPGFVNKAESQRIKKWQEGD